MGQIKEKWLQRLALITEAGSASPASEPRPETSLTSEPVSVEKGFECECPHGFYLPSENKVLCRTQLKSIKDWLPKDRKVSTEICDKCFSGLEYGSYGGFRIWQQKQGIQDQKREQRLAQQPRVTPKTVERSTYPPKSWFSGWEYDNIPCPKAMTSSDDIAVPLMCVETCLQSCSDLDRKQCQSFLKFRAQQKQKGEWLYE